MNTYVMADIHGCYDELQSMLKKVEFSEEDQLIIAGDYIDRGNQNLKMLRWVKNVPDNVLLIKGNHDVEFASCIDLMNMVVKRNNIAIDVNDERTAQLVYELTKQTINSENATYFDYYGTLSKLIYEDKVTLKNLNEWKAAIDDMPYLFRIRVNGKLFIIVHAGYIDKKKLSSTSFSTCEEFYIYARDEAYSYGGADNAVIISGHTPTVSKNNICFNNGDVFKKFDEERNCTFYNIDCGCAYKENQKNAKLACIRLEDEKIFYID